MRDGTNKSGDVLSFFFQKVHRAYRIGLFVNDSPCPGELFYPQSAFGGSHGGGNRRGGSLLSLSTAAYQKDKKDCKEDAALHTHHW